MAVSITLSITQNSQNITNNTSNVTVSAKVHWTGGSWNALGQCSGYITIDGTKYSYSGMSFNSSHTNSGSQTVMTKTVDVTHNEDGSKVLSCSTAFDTVISAGTINASASKVLTTIARASQPSLVTYPETTQNVGNFGVTFSIHMNRKSDSFTHTVRYEYGSRTGTIATKVTTGTTWAVPLAFMNDIPDATSGSGRIYVDTYNGSTLVGTKYTGFTATVPSSVKPSLTVTLDDTTGVDDIYGSPVKGLSKIKITPTVTLAYSSPIASYTITANGVTYNTATATTGLLTTAGSSVVTVTVKDKRGRSTTWSYTMSVLDYNAPAISKLTVKRCDSNGTENDQGEYCQLTLSATVTSLNSKNTATYKLRYKKSTATSWTESTITALSNKFSVTNHSQIFAADGNNSYDVEVVITDRHGSTTRSTSMSTAFTLYNCHPDGTGWRFGGVADKSNTLQNDLSLNQVGNSYAYQPGAFDGEEGYTLLAIITLSELNVNAPIIFEINKRGALCPMWVFACFASSSTTTDPELSTITYMGDNFGAFMVKAATSTWKLYVDNTSGWSNPCLQHWYTTENQNARLSISFMEEQVAGTEPSVLGTYYRATPAKMQSILDYIYPVGSIYLSYSHVSPASMFGGSWTRISDRFLWASSANATIGVTGGASTHTLTVDEMPSHNHRMQINSTSTSNSKYDLRPTSSQWQTESGTMWNMGWTNAVGSGAAHNNMPPYIQVSAWRRTA